MSAVKRPAGQFRVGDMVEFLFGAQLVLGRVTEYRGPIGVGGRRLYRIDLEGGEEPTTLELPEEDLAKASEADASEWRRSGRTTAVHQTVTYQGEQKDARGLPRRLFHYLIVARPGQAAGTGTASVISLSEARATGVAQSPSRAFQVEAGGPAAALTEAEAFLDEQHRGLTKTVGPRRR